MRILLDECVDRRLKSRLPEHQVNTVQELGWAGKKNGELLELAVNGFDVFLTVDQNLRYQQQLLARPIAVAILLVPANTLKHLLVLLPKLEAALRTIQSGECVLVE